MSAVPGQPSRATRDLSAPGDRWCRGAADRCRGTRARCQKLLRPRLAVHGDNGGHWGRRAFLRAGVGQTPEI